MKIPKKIKVLGHEWVTRYKWNLMLDDMHCDGLCVYDDRTIFLDRGLRVEERWNVYFHELFHAMCFELKLNRRLSSDMEEILADNWGEFLADTFNFRIKK